MAQEYGKYGDSSYSQYPTDDKKYECSTGSFEGFVVSSVEFCKQVKFDDKDKKTIEITYNYFIQLIILMSEMSKDEIRSFLLQGTFTGKLGTINKNGIPHVVPIWYTLDEDNIIFNTGKNSVKAKNIQRDNRVRLCVDDQIPLYSFVTIDGIAEIISNKPNELFKWAKIIAARYMGNDKAEEYGKRNSSEEELLIKIKSTKIVGQKDIAGW